MNRHRTSIVLAALLLTMLAVTGAAFIGLAAADHSTNVLLDANETVDANSDTAWVDVTDTNNTDVHVTFYGVAGDGTETKLKNVTINNGANTTNTTEYNLSDADRTDYDEIRMLVEGDEVGSTAFGMISTIPQNELMNETASISNDTLTAWAEVTDTGGADVRLDVYGIDSGGNETFLADFILNAGASATDFAEYSLSDAELDSYDEVRFIIEGDSVQSTDYGVTVTLSGGTSSSSSWFSGETAGVTNWVLIVIALAVVGMVYKGKDE